MTPALAQLQADFQSRLMTGAQGIDGHLKKGGPFMRVYDHAYKARLIEVMADEFESLHTLLGDEKFHAAMLAYFDIHPSSTRSARWIGRNLADWLGSTAPWSNYPEAVAMARFEWALSLAFDARDADAIGFDDIAGVPPEAWLVLTFNFHPALNVFALTHDVAPFYRAAKADEVPEAAPEPFAEPETWAAWRDPETLMSMYRSLEADEAAMLSAAMSGQTFEAMCEFVAAAGDPDQAAMRAAGLLRRWIESGWVIGVDADGMSW